MICKFYMQTLCMIFMGTENLIIYLLLFCFTLKSWNHIIFKLEEYSVDSFIFQSLEKHFVYIIKILQVSVYDLLNLSAQNDVNKTYSGEENKWIWTQV